VPPKSLAILTFIIITLELFFLISKRNISNRYHLDYLIFFTGSILLLVITHLFGNLFLTPMQRFYLINIFHITSLILYFQHSLSVLNGFRVRFNKIYLLLFFIYFLVALLSESQIFLFNHQTRQTLLININAKYFGNLSDVMITKLILDISIVLFNLFKIRKLLLNSVFLKKKRQFKLWIYSFSFMYVALIILVTALYFDLFNFRINHIFVVTANFMSFFQVTLITFHPTILTYFINFKNQHSKNKFDSNSHKKISNLFEIENFHLNFNVKLNDVAIKTGLTNSEIRDSIKNFSGKSFNDFINEYRINYSVELIKDSYLDNHTVISLGVKCGFSSHQTFFKAFHKIHKTTPNKFKNQYFLNESKNMNLIQ
jgi:AraC-like DNA-binding protein